MPKRRICFVTGTRAEFGLMASALRQIVRHPELTLQLIATGMHLDRSRGYSLKEIRADGFKIDATVPWPASGHSQSATAVATGKTISGLASAYEKLKSEIILVVGDRVEAFAAASAAHISGRLVAHIHGGDRALGLVDDSLRHAITKLAHLHFPATLQSAKRLQRMGEDKWRIVRAGSPGLDDLRSATASRTDILRQFPGLPVRKFALLVLHPQTASEQAEANLATKLLCAIHQAEVDHIVIVHPNNDPGSRGIVRVWDSLSKTANVSLHRNLPRGIFLGLLRDAAFLIGNSSSGIIEAASYGTPVIDIGSRQLGRERGKNVSHAPKIDATLAKSIRRIWRGGLPFRFPNRNPYGTGNAGIRIAHALSLVDLDRARKKLIAY